jgi:hypothetical protein
VNGGDHEAGFLSGKYGDACRGANGDAGGWTRHWQCIHPGLRPRLSLKKINRCTPTKPKPFGRSDLQTTPRLSRAGRNIGFR